MLPSARAAANVEAAPGSTSVRLVLDPPRVPNRRCHVQFVRHREPLMLLARWLPIRNMVQCGVSQQFLRVVLLYGERLLVQTSAADDLAKRRKRFFC